MTAVKTAAEKATQARESIGRVIHGNRDAIDLLLVALATGGHALLEGVPGVGKTTLAKTFATVTGLQFRRVQLTPDLMPSDITGHMFFNQAESRFEVREGPVFTNVLLADEINRAPPRTQSALLEVMQEQQVTIEGRSLPVPRPFVVVATKNPIDTEGVYPLPESELDRFMLRIHVDYPREEIEQEMLLGKLSGRPAPTAVPGLVEALEAGLAHVRIHKDLVAYLLSIVRATRSQPELVMLGAGPRGSEHLLAASRARALLEGRDFVLPDDIKQMAPPTLAHRLMLTADAEISGLSKVEVIERILKELPVPVEASEAR